MISTRYFYKRENNQPITLVWDSVSLRIRTRYLSRVDGIHNSDYVGCYNMDVYSLNVTYIHFFKEKNNILNVTKDCI